MMMMVSLLLTVAVGLPVVVAAEGALGEPSVVAIQDTRAELRPEVEFLGVVALTTVVIIAEVTDGETEEEQLKVFEGLGDALGLAPYERVDVGLIVDNKLGFVELF